MRQGFIQFKNCAVHIDAEHEYLETVFAGGAVCAACANHTPADEAYARKLGYPNTWLMTRDHEVLHTQLCEALGLAFSPTLYAVACGTVASLDPALIAHEEAMVLSAQAFRIAVAHTVFD